ncbi:M48 family metalloprotease [Moorellaceae bacterium AZ2]
MILKGFRLAVLGCIVVLNWFLIGLCLAIFGLSDNAAFFWGFVIEAALVALALSPAGETYFRAVTRLRPPLGREKEVLIPAFERVAARCGLAQKPDIFVQRDSYPNAFAVGTKTVAVTEGLLKSATVEELEAVLAHEVAHLQNGDTKVRLIAYVSNLAGTVALWIATAFMFIMSLIGFGAGEFDREYAGVGWVFLLFAWTLKLAIWILTKILELSFLAVNRGEEYAADEYAASKGYRDALVFFLNRMPDDRPRSIAAALYATHPSSEARITKLMNYGR